MVAAGHSWKDSPSEGSWRLMMSVWRELTWCRRKCGSPAATAVVIGGGGRREVKRRFSPSLDSVLEC